MAARVLAIGKVRVLAGRRFAKAERASSANLVDVLLEFVVFCYEGPNLRFLFLELFTIEVSVLPDEQDDPREYWHEEDECPGPCRDRDDRKGDKCPLPPPEQFTPLGAFSTHHRVLPY